MSTVWLNGAFMPQSEARISPLDRGFLFADGVYEVIPVYQGHLFRLDAHLQRLDHSLSAIALPNPLDGHQWRDVLTDLVAHNGGGNLAIYLQVTRGATQQRDHGFPPAGTAPTLFAMTSPVAPPPAETPETTEGVAAITLDDIRWVRCDIKSIALLPNILMRQQAVELGAAEAILLRDGFVTEGAASNIFIVRKGQVTTPPRSHLILGGITRDLVIELGREQGLCVEEGEIQEAELRTAGEIWLTSSTREIVPVVSLNGHPVGNGKPGPVWKQMAYHYVQLKRTLCGLAS